MQRAFRPFFLEQERSMMKLKKFEILNFKLDESKFARKTKLFWIRTTFHMGICVFAKLHEELKKRWRTERGRRVFEI